MRSRGTTTRGFSSSGQATVIGLAVGLTGLAGLGGCSGGPEPTPSVTWTPVYESPWPESTPTPTPTPTDAAAIPPERPAAMDEVSIAGAEAFATYYLELYPYVFATGDLETYRTHSHPECIFCADVISTAEAQRAAGGHTEGGLVDVQEVTALEVDPGKWWAVSMEVVEASLVDVDGDGTVINQAAEAAYHLDLAVVRESGTWLMREVSHEVTG